MGLLTNIGHMFLDGIGPIEMQTRHVSDFPSWDEQMARIWRRGSATWPTAGVNEALSSPAIFAAVTLISNTVGSLSMEAFRRGVKMPQESAPRIIQRPNPFTTTRVFLRDTAFHLATRGEAWWWVAVRDPIDNTPMSLYPVPPWEVTVEENDRNLLKPIIKWKDRVIPNEDMRQITYLPGRDGRGKGPLQMCGAAVSVAVEAEQWAANFFSGSIPSMIGTTDQDMTPDELAEMDKQWNEKPANLPRWLTNGLTMSESPFSPEKAQLTDSRNANVGDAARMFNMPGPLIEYQMSGSSLTYRNDETIWTDFQRRCLSPNYLEPIEQEISDLLTRSMVARFNLKQLLRGSAKERAEVYAQLVPIGVITAEEARQDEGYQAGSVDFAPVPQAPPQAVPSILPPNQPITRSREVRCPAGHLLAELASPPYKFTCFRCKRQVAA